MSDLLKFLTCGSVDDGKSTLIGHMLYDAKLLFADQKQALELESKIGSREGLIDYSLLLDGLIAEREQGITIDVAYRYFTTNKRSFIVADAPGHEQYTRNMAVAASFADLAVILVDATKGIVTQTKRHVRICSLMGIRYFCFIVNKMDLLQYSYNCFKEIEKEIYELKENLELDNVYVIPVSATEGDNLTCLSLNMEWYTGRDLLNYLEELEIIDYVEEAGFSLPIQRVCRPNHLFRGYEGQVSSGRIVRGEEIQVFPGGEKAKIKEIYIGDKESNRATKGMPVTITLDREIDISRGCVISNDASVKVGQLFTAQILWMDDEELVEGQTYILKLSTKEISASIMEIKFKVDINSGAEIAASKVKKNDLAVCDINVLNPIAYKEFKQCKELGSFILINKLTNATSACGIILHSLRRDENIFEQQLDVTRELRCKRLNQKPITIWFTGLSGSGKSTIANALEKKLYSEGFHTMLLDGDNVRLGLNKNLGFEPEDRIENIRRIAEVSKLMNDAGLIVITSFISPYESDRENAKRIIGKENMVEVYISTPLEICRERDVKGLYKKAECGEIPNFTGISSKYEVPQKPDIELDTSDLTVSNCVDRVMEYIIKIEKES